MSRQVALDIPIKKTQHRIIGGSGLEGTLKVCLV